MQNLEYKEHGIVKSAAGCIARVVGLQNCLLGQLVKFSYGTEGIIVGFDLEVAQVLVVKENEPITPGNQVVATLEPFNMPTGEKFVGRIINPLGDPMDGLGPIQPDKCIPYFNEAPGIMDRESLSRTLETGVKLIDATLPLGRGQRSLILGDKMTGKTTVGTDIILNQKGQDVICIYCAIGKPRAAVARVVELFQERGAFEYTTVIQALANTSPGQQYLAIYAACAIGEYFMYSGRDVFVLFDDFTKHAWAYRELSLLMEVPPGRDSYPGDVFYLHSRMIERAAQLNKKLGGGSMTFIPIVELLEGDLTAYVPTNLVSMTDGQIVLNMTLFNEGFRPAVDVGLSVSRVGTKVQWKAMKSVSKSLRLEFIQYKETLKTSKLQTGSQSDEMKAKLESGKILEKLLTQPANSPVRYDVQIMAFFAKEEGLLKGFDPGKIQDLLSGLGAFTEKEDPELFKAMRESKDLTDDVKKRIKEVMVKYIEALNKQDTTVETQEKAA